MNKKILFIFLPFIFWSFSILAQPMMKKFTKPGIVFSASLIEKLSKDRPPFWGSKPPYWTPSKNEIDELEPRLAAYLSESKDKRAKVLAQKVYSYGRQYVGISSSAGKKVILVNGFCDSFGLSDSELQNKVLEVDDGGDCYFQIYYHPDSKTFSSLQINGEA